MYTHITGHQLLAKYLKFTHDSYVVATQCDKSVIGNLLINFLQILHAFSYIKAPFFVKLLGEGNCL